MSVSVMDKIVQYQKSIEKYHGNEEKLLYYIKKLAQLPVTVTHLQETGVGRTINSLRKSNGDVRAAAKNLVSKWKDMVAAEEAEEEQVENIPEEVVPERKFASPDSSSHKRRVTDNHSNSPDKRRRKETSTDESHDSGHSRNSHHQREHGDGWRSDPSPEKKKAYSSYSADESPLSPDGAYENGHHSDSDEEELRIEDDVQEESQSASDVEPSEPPHRSYSQDSNYSAQQSSDSESTKKASSSKSHSHKDSKHRDSSKHHHDQKAKSSKKDHSSSSHKSKEEKKDKGEKSHRKHEKHKSKESSKEEEAKKSPKKSHHSSSSSHKSKDKESRSKENIEKISSVKSRSEIKIKQEPVDTYEVKIKQEPLDKPSSSEKTDRTESKKSSSGSSSSKSDKHKDKRKSSDKDRSKEKKEDKKSSQKEKMKDLEDEGVDSFSGASFGDVLGMIGPSKSSKKKSLSSPSTSKGVAGYDPLRPDLNYEKGRNKVDKDLLDSPSEEESYTGNYSSLRPSAIEEDLLLPEISPHYKPLPQANYLVSPTKRIITDDEALSNIIYSKQMRTKVYSGNKSGYSHVPSLFEICTRVLQDNIEALGPTGGVPFDILRPVLEHATAEQLAVLEHYNPYLIEDTDSIWKYHCQKDFRNKRREEMETWRDMYIRCGEEREQKLKSLTSSIQNSMAKWTPVRKTKLAYVEGTVKPPRGIARKQARYGSAVPQPKALTSTSKSSSDSPKPSTSSAPSTASSTSSFGGRQTVMAAPTVSVPNPRAGSSHTSSGSLKPKPKAPLMQKALQLVKNRYKR